jgi:hypothetical protein
MRRGLIPATALALALSVLTTLTCSPGAYTINAEEFSASDACNAEGTYEVRTQDDRVSATAMGEIKAEFIQAGGFGATLWCHGLRHRFIGRVEHGGYVFESDAENPLQFVVDRDKGYHYEQGAGTVTGPNGEQRTFQ